MNSIYKHLRESRILNEKQDYANMTPEELATLSKGGDQLAISTLINKLDSDGFFYKMTKKYIPEGTMDSDDIYQTAQIGVWDAIQKWDGSGDFEAFAGMVVKNKLVDAFRHLDTDTARANRDTRSVSSIDDESDDDEVHGDMSASEYNSYIKSTSHKSAEDEYNDSQAVKEIMDFLRNECSEQEQQVIKLYIDGYKMAQISEMTGMKYKSCENALRRAKEKLSVFVKSMEESRKILRESALLSNQEKEILRQAFAMMSESLSEDIGGGDDEDPDYFEYKGIIVEKDGNKWIASDGKSYMGYLTPRDIKQWIDKDSRNYESKKINESTDVELPEGWEKLPGVGYSYSYNKDNVFGFVSISNSLARPEEIQRTMYAYDQTTRSVIFKKDDTIKDSPRNISDIVSKAISEVDTSISKIGRNNTISESKDLSDVDEHLEVSPNSDSTTAQKVDYVKKMVKKAKLEGDEHSAWDIVDFLWDSMLLDKIPLNESVDEEQPTQEEIDQATDRLAAILSELEDIYIDISEVRSWEEFSDKLKRAEELGHEVVLKFEDEFNDEDVNDLVEECNDLRRKIENADYEGPSENPMTAAGMKMSDFI